MKAAKILLCLVAVSAVSSVIGSPAEDGRIANGFAIPIEKAAYMVRLTHSSNITCGGSLISPDCVVTAAHCVVGRSWDGLTVIANATSINEPGIRRKVSIVTMHPEYIEAQRHSDIAVLLLESPIEGATTLELCNKPLKEKDEVQISGWGRLGEYMPRSTTLQTVFLKVASNETCEREFKELVQKNMFCAGIDYKATGKGDSGGPAVFEEELCGVLAFGYTRDILGRLEAYTDVYAVKEFIQDTLSHYSDVAYRDRRILEEKNKNAAIMAKLEDLNSTI